MPERAARAELPTMTLFEELQWRGMVSQTTHEDLPEVLDREPLTLYCGFDPTADSLHIGSLLPIIGLMRFQRAGHRPVALVGGATGMIGDPSFKTDERKLLDKDQLERNVAGIRAVLGRFLDFDGASGAVLVNNADWLGAIPMLDFLRDVGKHFSVNVMISRESVRARLEDREHGISYTEFSYQLLQAYDFLHLHDTLGCRLQVGGSDQWGNITAGMDLTRRLREGARTYGLTFPLITKSDGTKFGKSESGNVWLNARYTSPYKFYQFLVNQADADTARLLRLFTFLPPPEIEALDRELAEAPEQRAAQRRLAEELTRLVHGDAALAGAEKASRAMFGGDLAGLDAATLNDVFGEVPSTTLPVSTLEEGKALVDVAVGCGVFASKGEARKMIASGGFYLNNGRVDADTTLTPAALMAGGLAVLRKGKKQYHLLRFE
jgi:tyrosyl-tRNA synthetase